MHVHVHSYACTSGLQENAGCTCVNLGGTLAYLNGRFNSQHDLCGMVKYICISVGGTASLRGVPVDRSVKCWSASLVSTGNRCDNIAILGKHGVVSLSCG